ncbi:MAG: Fe-S cluster assembly protein SufD [Geobacter sp.]|nr:MAG: Fe-S cluster assembly protein SufD [Geobacter sp.]
MITPTAYREALSRIDAPSSFAALRQTALRKFLQAGLPDSRQEDWRYTSLRHLERMPLHAPAAMPETLPALEDYPGALLAYLDDRLVWQDTTLPATVLGVLADAIGTETPAAFGNLAGNGLVGSSLTQLNAALWREGACLRVPAGERLRQPVFLRFAAAEADAMLYPRVFINMAVGSDAILVEHFLGDPGIAYWQNPVTEIVLEAGARLTHLRIVEDSNLATHTGLTAVHLGQDSNYRALNLTFGGLVARHELNVTLAGVGAEVRLDGVFIADGLRGAEQHLRIVHQAPRGKSRTLYRGLADGRGRGVFDARVEVRPHADGSDAQQSSRNLLLSPHAEIDAKPQLEIYADDVKCGHGATVGSLDEDALFYLRSRGIDGDSARQLLLHAFVGEALGLLDDTGLRDWLMPRLLARMPRSHLLEPRPWTH